MVYERFAFFAHPTIKITSRHWYIVHSIFVYRITSNNPPPFELGWKIIPHGSLLEVIRYIFSLYVCLLISTLCCRFSTILLSNNLSPTKSLDVYKSHIYLVSRCISVSCDIHDLPWGHQCLIYVVAIDKETK